jgi:predicted amidophosphoribosyltransferase
MSALAVEEVDLPTEELCTDCGRGLAESDETLCADCTDLALHTDCRDCGRVLRDTDVDAGVCSDCLA